MNETSNYNWANIGNWANTQGNNFINYLDRNSSRNAMFGGGTIDPKTGVTQINPGWLTSGLGAATDIYGMWLQRENMRAMKQQIANQTALARTNLYNQAKQINEQRDNTMESKMFLDGSTREQIDNKLNSKEYNDSRYRGTF